MLELEFVGDDFDLEWFPGLLFVYFGMMSYVRCLASELEGAKVCLALYFLPFLMLRVAKVSAQIHRGLITLFACHGAPPAFLIRFMFIYQVLRKIVFRVENCFALATGVQGMHILQVLVDKRFCFEFAAYTDGAVTHWIRIVFLSFTFLAVATGVGEVFESLLDRSEPPVTRQEVPFVQLHFTG